MDSDLYPNDGSYFQPGVPEQTEAAKEKEREEAATMAPQLDKLIKWFDAAIESTDSRKAMHEEAKRRQKSLEVVNEAYDIVREVLEKKRGELSSLKLSIPE